MKKTILFAALLASTATFASAQDGAPAPRGPRPERKIELSKLPEQMPQELKDKMKEADKNGDGFVEGEELQGLFPAQGNRPRFGGPGFSPQGQAPRFGFAGPQGPGFRGFGPGPMFGAPGFGPGPQGQAPRFGFGDAFKDGKIELAKLPERVPQEQKDKMKAADKDGDGFLTAEEMKALAPKFERPAFLAEGGKIDVAKLTEALKAADKNNDGFIDQDERKDAVDAAQKKFGPMFLTRLTQGSAPFAPQWGAPQPWGGQGPQGDFNRNRAPRREGDRPQAERGQRRNGDRPQAERGQRRRGDRPQGDQPKAK
jgi:Ca2+-binding EF-hand superfamily protein